MFFILQAMVPAGFMPAALSSGQFVQLCPTGLSQELMQILHPGHAEPGADQHAGHHMHMGHDDMSSHQAHSADSADRDAHMSWRADCPFGALSPTDHALQLASGQLALAAPGSIQLAIPSLTATPRNPLFSPPARAPPQINA